MKTPTAVVVCTFLVMSGVVGFAALNMNRPRVVQEVERVERVHIVHSESQPEQELSTITAEQNEVPLENVLFPRGNCTSIGIVEYVGQEERRWDAIISGVYYKSAILTPYSDDVIMTRKIRVGQLVCIQDPQGDKRLKSFEIHILRQP